MSGTYSREEYEEILDPLRWYL